MLMLMTAAVFWAGGAGFARPPGQTEVVVSAAASLSNVLQAIKVAFEKENRHIHITLNFGSSGTLQRQIEAGAPVDLFLAAAPQPLTDLAAAGLVDPATVAILATNKVVLIRNHGAGSSTGPTSGGGGATPTSDPVTVRSWEDLRSSGLARVAIGEPSHVPAGQYAKAVLEHLGLWSVVQAKLVMGEDVRQVVHFVESGDVPAGVVYLTDALVAKGVDVVAEAPSGSCETPVYPMAVLKNAKHMPEAQRFYDFLRSATAREVLKQYGFAPEP